MNHWFANIELVSPFAQGLDEFDFISEEKLNPTRIPINCRHDILYSSNILVCQQESQLKFYWRNSAGNFELIPTPEFPIKFDTKWMISQKPKVEYEGIDFVKWSGKTSSASLKQIRNILITMSF